jgi:hypothetical protein
MGDKTMSLRDATIQNVPKNVTDAALAAQNPIELREAILAAMEQSGMVLPRSRNDEFDIRYNPDAIERPTVSMPVGPAPAPTCVRVIYPFQNDRYEIFASSEKELDAKEAAIRAIYARQR